MDTFIGQLILFAGNFAPRGWAMCQGQLMSIAENTALFSLLGTTYGGDGITTFGLPDLRGRAPIGFAQGPGLSDYQLGESAGVETVTLLTTQLPAHSHPAGASRAAGSAATPENNVPAAGRGRALAFYAPTADTTLSPKAIGPTGGSQPHENRSPYLAMNYIIALQGIYPSRG